MILRTVLILLLTGSSLFAQEGLEEFRALFAKTQQYYQQTDAYALSVRYGFYEKGKPAPVEELTGRIDKQGNNYCSKIGQTQFLYIGNHFLKINHQEQAVLYSKVEGKQSFSPMDIGSMMGYFKDAVIEKEGGSYRCLIQFKQLQGIPYKAMTLVLDGKDYSIRHQTLEMLPDTAYPGFSTGSKQTRGGRMRIDLKQISTESREAGLFNLSHYIVTGGAIGLSKELSDYTLYNTTQ